MACGHIHGILGTQETPSQEFSWGFERTNMNPSDDPGCCERAAGFFCVTIINSAYIVLRPLAYLVNTVAFLILSVVSLACCNTKEAKSRAGKSLNYFLCMLISPFGGAIKTVRCALGIFCPAAAITYDDCPAAVTTQDRVK